MAEETAQSAGPDALKALSRKPWEELDTKEKVERDHKVSLQSEMEVKYLRQALNELTSIVASHSHNDAGDVMQKLTIARTATQPRGVPVPSR